MTFAHGGFLKVGDRPGYYPPESPSFDPWRDPDTGRLIPCLCPAPKAIVPTPKPVKPRQGTLF